MRLPLIRRTFLFAITFLLSQCKDPQQSASESTKSEKQPQDTSITVKDQVPDRENKLPGIPKDTLIEYTIEDISSESSEAKVHYVNGAIHDVDWYIYGETGQCNIKYTFLPNGTLKALEKRYAYPAGLQSVKTEKDMKLRATLEYQLDTNGVLLSKVKEEDFANVFEDFKKNVPLNLR